MHLRLVSDERSHLFCCPTQSSRPSWVWVGYVKYGLVSQSLAVENNFHSRAFGVDPSAMQLVCSGTTHSSSSSSLPSSASSTSSHSPSSRTSGPDLRLGVALTTVVGSTHSGTPLSPGGQRINITSLGRSQSSTPLRMCDAPSPRSTCGSGRTGGQRALVARPRSGRSLRCRSPRTPSCPRGTSH